MRRRILLTQNFAFAAKENNPFVGIRKELDVDGSKYAYYSLPDLGDARVGDSA